MANLNRRNFLSTSAVAVAAASAGRYGVATAADAAEAKSSSEPLVLGAIGLGIRGTGIMRDGANFGRVVALCDVDSAHLARGKSSLEDFCKSRGRPSPDPELFEDYRRVLDRQDIDAVIIGTPDHWHTKIAIDAMRAGKDVYCEKPLTLTIAEGQQIVKVQEETQRVFQVGTQQRTDKRFQTAVAMLRDGRAGAVKRVTCGIGGAPSSPEIPAVDAPADLNWDMWLGQAPMVDYRQTANRPEGGYGNQFPYGRAHAHFRWWYEYAGGKLTDWGAHHVDIAMWALDRSDGSIGKFSIDPLRVEHPVPLQDGMPTVDNQFNTATRFHVRVTFEDGVEMDICDNSKELGFGNGIMFQGDAGRYFVNRGKLTGKAAQDLEENPLPQDVVDAIYPHGSNDAWQMQNFVDCVNSRSTPISDVASHHRHLTVCHATNIAMRLGRKLVWDPAIEQFVGDDQANGMIAREQRKGYEIDA